MRINILEAGLATYLMAGSGLLPWEEEPPMDDASPPEAASAAPPAPPEANSPKLEAKPAQA